MDAFTDILPKNRIPVYWLYEEISHIGDYYLLPTASSQILCNEKISDRVRPRSFS